MLALRRGENRSTRRKTSRSRVENQQTQPTYDAESGNRTRATLVEGECSTTAPTLLPIIIASLARNIGVYLPHGLGFLCSHRGSNLIFHAHCLLSKKLVAALIVTGEGRAETIADNNSKTMQYIFPPGENFSSIFPQHIKIYIYIQPSQ